MRFGSISLLLITFLLISCGGGSGDCIEKRVSFGFFTSANCQEVNVKSTTIDDGNIKIKNINFFMNSSAIINQP
jgi:hypothetical protein